MSLLLVAMPFAPSSVRSLLMTEFIAESRALASLPKGRGVSPSTAPDPTHPTDMTYAST